MQKDWQLFHKSGIEIDEEELENMIDELQIDSLAAGLHRSDAVKRYQENGITKRFKLISAAFGEPLYKVDEKLEIIERTL